MSQDAASGPRPRWRSGAVRLVLLGTAGSVAALLGGCASGPDTFQQNVYASRADCERDYDSVRCAQGPQAGLSRVLGPSYRVVNGRPSACTASDPGPGRNAMLSPRIGVERSGFGPRCNRRSAAGQSFRSWGS